MGPVPSTTVWVAIVADDHELRGHYTARTLRELLRTLSADLCSVTGPLTRDQRDQLSGADMPTLAEVLPDPGPDGDDALISAWTRWHAEFFAVLTDPPLVSWFNAQVPDPHPDDARSATP